MDDRYTDYLIRLWHPWRMLTRQRCALPSFVIVGTQKGGTTYLYSLLSTHPQIVRSSLKEVQYFTLNWGRSERWYRTHFPSSSALAHKSYKLDKPVITGEASPYYMFHPQAMQRMAKVLPDAKIILLLRDPVKRAISHYHHNVARGVESLSFSDAIQAEPIRLAGELDKMAADDRYQSAFYRNFSYFERGVYLPQVKRIEAHYPKDRILVLQSELFFRDPVAVANQVCAYLELEAWNPALQVRMNQGKYNPIDPSALESLRERYEPQNQSLYGHLKADYGW